MATGYIDQIRNKLSMCVLHTVACCAQHKHFLGVRVYVLFTFYVSFDGSRRKKKHAIIYVNICSLEYHVLASLRRQNY